MSHPQDKNPQDITPEVYDLAAQLYAKHTQMQSTDTLMQAEKVKEIPPEFIQQAYTQIQGGEMQASAAIPLYTPAYAPPQRKNLIKSLAAVLTGAALLAGVGIYFLMKGMDKPVAEPVPVTQAPPASTCVPNDVGDNLGGVNFAGKDLTCFNLRSANLGGANLSNANLRGVDLSGADLSGANLNNADLSNANLNFANLRGANLNNAVLDGATFDGAKLDGANLGGATLPSKNKPSQNTPAQNNPQ